VIATISVPGGRNFEWKRVKNRAEAEAWRRQWLEICGESQETLGAVRQGLLLTEKEARGVRYLDGSKVFGHPELGVVDMAGAAR
jgi:hypothetical protein